MAGSRIPSFGEGPHRVPLLQIPRPGFELQPPSELAKPAAKGSRRNPPSPARAQSPALRENPAVEGSSQPSSPTRHILGAPTLDIAAIVCIKDTCWLAVSLNFLGNNYRHFTCIVHLQVLLRDMFELRWGGALNIK